LLRGLDPYGYRDTFRLLHPDAVDELSWEWPRSGGGYRLDHLITSSEVAVNACRYEPSWRQDGPL
jgi:hypothetical protein